MSTGPDEIFVDGRWSLATGARHELINPATEETMGTAVAASPADVARAVSAARRSFDEGPWRHRSLEQRIEVLTATFRLMAQNAERFAQLQTAQMGAPITVSRMLVATAPQLLQAYVEGVRRIAFEYLRRDASGQSLIRQEPVGVVAIVLPWNGPLSALVSTCIPALLTGCSLVLKPAPETPLEAGLFAELSTAAGLPDGVFNVVTGGADTGESLVTDVRVDRVNFTGSTDAGRRVGALCGGRLARAGLELGGKSAGILLDDADLDTAIPDIVSANFFNSGQICIALTRVLVPLGRRDEIVDALSEVSANQVVGDPLDTATQLGPLVTSRHRDRVEAYVAAGRAAGARVVLGGERPAHLRRGWFYQPTIFTEVDNTMSIAREEIFGPVLSVIAYRSEAEAIAIANDSSYGLHGAVYGKDPTRALDVAMRVHSGSMGINTGGLTPGTPYGGVKGSGVGRQHGREGLSSLLELHSYVIPQELAAELEARGLDVA